MLCPYCEFELKYHDYYGKKRFADHYYLYPQSWIEKEGDIYICDNEDCENYGQHFYTDQRNELKEGYPC